MSRLPRREPAPDRVRCAGRILRVPCANHRGLADSGVPVRIGERGRNWDCLESRVGQSLFSRDSNRDRQRRENQPNRRTLKLPLAQAYPVGEGKMASPMAWPDAVTRPWGRRRRILREGSKPVAGAVTRVSSLTGDDGASLVSPDAGKTR